MIWREGKTMAGLGKRHLMDGLHVSDSSVNHSVGLEGGRLCIPSCSWGLSGLWLLRIELADSAEENHLLQFLTAQLICSAKVF